MPYNIGIYTPVEPSILKFLPKLGVDAIFIEPKKEAIKNAQNAKMKTYVHIWPFRTPTKENIYKVKNIFDNKTFWGESGCPNNQKLRSFTLERIKKLITDFELDGIVLDGIRFPSPGSGFNSFLTCFCENCKTKAVEMGYKFNLMKHDMQLFVPELWNHFLKIRAPIDLLNIGQHYSGVVEWIKFRCDSITEYIKDLRGKIKEIVPNMEFGTTLFAPSLAPLVGQDYAKITQYVDFIQPMIYHRGNGPACINYELSKLVEEDVKKEFHSEILKSMYRLFGYKKYNPPLNLMELKKGLPLSIISLEAEKVQLLANNKDIKITPILFILNSSAQEITQCRRHILKAQPDGIVYFAYFKGLKNLDLN